MGECCCRYRPLIKSVPMRVVLIVPFSFTLGVGEQNPPKYCNILFPASQQPYLCVWGGGAKGELLRP